MASLFNWLAHVASLPFLLEDQWGCTLILAGKIHYVNYFSRLHGRSPPLIGVEFFDRNNARDEIMVAEVESFGSFQGNFVY